VCLENRISHWKDAIGSKDAIIIHNPLESGEESMLAYVGESIFSLTGYKLVLWKFLNIFVKKICKTANFHHEIL
jgi:hypothetical protein